jgi:membrane fusion protein
MAVISSQRSLSRHIIVVIAFAILLIGGVGGWAATTSLSNAIIGEASVIISDNVKKIQHLNGGIVSQLRVKEGQHVEAGDILLSLDGTSVKANLGIVESALAQLYIRRSRLTAERLGQASFSVEDLKEKGLDGVSNQKFVQGEISLFESRISTLVGKRKQLEERKAQLQNEIEGDTIQLKSIEDSTVLVQEELDAIEALYAQKLVTMQRVNSLKRQKTDLDGQRGQKLSARAQAEGRINEVSLQILQLDEDRRAENSSDLTEVDAKVAEYEQRRIAIKDQMARLDVTAPLSGRVYQLGVHTIGGVVTPPDVLMLLAPDDQALTVEAKIASRDIDQIRTGQKVDIRFSAFDQRRTPAAEGEVVSISPDIVHDERTGVSYYPVRILPVSGSLTKLDGLTLYPGMPAEVFIKIAERPVISYLTKPLMDQISHTFREE